jgi:hypothetical protein
VDPPASVSLPAIELPTVAVSNESETVNADDASWKTIPTKPHNNTRHIFICISFDN